MQVYRPWKWSLYMPDTSRLFMFLKLIFNQRHYFIGSCSNVTPSMWISNSTLCKRKPLRKLLYLWQGLHSSTVLIFVKHSFRIFFFLPKPWLLNLCSWFSLSHLSLHTETPFIICFGDNLMLRFIYLYFWENFTLKDFQNCYFALKYVFLAYI